jgi:hypothetical protein
MAPASPPPSRRDRIGDVIAPHDAEFFSSSTCQTARSLRCEFPLHIFAGRICGRKTGSHFSCKCSQSSAGPADDRARASTPPVVSFFLLPKGRTAPKGLPPRGDGAPRRRCHKGHASARPARRSRRAALSAESARLPALHRGGVFRPGPRDWGFTFGLRRPEPANGSQTGHCAGGRIPGTPGSLRFVDEGAQAPQSPLRRWTTPGVSTPRRRAGMADR